MVSSVCEITFPVFSSNMAVHFKFHSSAESHFVQCEEDHIALADLKKIVMKRYNIQEGTCHLQFSDSNTNLLYEGDNSLVPRAATLTIRRLPCASPRKKMQKIMHPLSETDAAIERGNSHWLENLAESNLSEEEKIKRMIEQSNPEYDPKNYVNVRRKSRPVTDYSSLYKRRDPRLSARLSTSSRPYTKRSTGIPHSFLVPAAPNERGARLTSSGFYAVPRMEREAYQAVKKEKPPLVKEEKNEEVPVPQYLICVLCRRVMEDAALAGCCGNSSCDECLRQAVLESENRQCPLCNKRGVSPKDIFPNINLRKIIERYQCTQL